MNSAREEILRTFGRLSELAEVCRSLGVISDYMAKNYTRADGSFLIIVSVNVFEGGERHTWESYQNSFGDDRELHANMTSAKEVNDYLLALIREEYSHSDRQKQVIKDYLASHSL